jgi:hypothetical protein
MRRWLTRFARGGFVLGIVASALGPPLLAHHSFSVYYIEADTIEIEGDVIEFQYKNPHAWIFVQGTEAFGPPKIYAAEWVSTSQLERNGIDKKFFKPGDALRIWASPNKNPGDNRVRLKRMERRSDHWKWAGNRGDTR